MARRSAKETSTGTGCRPIPLLNDTQLEDGLAVVRSDIDVLQRKICSISDQIKQQSHADVDCQHRRCAVTGKLAEVRSEIESLMNAKAHLQHRRSVLSAAGSDRREELERLKKAIGYSGESEIVNRRHTIESVMKHSTISLKQERFFMKELAELNKKVMMVRQVEAQYQVLESQGITTKVKQISLDLANALSQKNAYREEIEGLKAQRAGIASAVQEMFQQRDECNSFVHEKVQRLNAMMAEQRKRSAVWQLQAEAGTENMCPVREEREMDAQHQQSPQQPGLAQATEIVLIKQCLEVCAELESQTAEAWEQCPRRIGMAFSEAQTGCLSTGWHKDLQATHTLATANLRFYHPLHWGGVLWKKLAGPFEQLCACFCSS